MTEEQLNDLSIFALRELARRTGVESPTSKKKGELIKEIIEISEGIRTPKMSKNKQGRPPKSTGYSFVDVFNSQIKEAPQSKVTFNQPKINFEYRDIKTIAGVLEVLSEGNGLLWIRKATNYQFLYITDELISLYKLKTGDKLLVELTNEHDSVTVEKILSINDTPIMKFSTSRRDFYNIGHLESKRLIDFVDKMYSDLHIRQGENIFLYGDNNLENTYDLIKMLNSAKNCKKIYINITIAEKNRSILDTLTNVELFVADITADLDETRRLVSLAIERAKRILESGEDVIVAVDDMQSISGLDTDMHSARNLISITKCGKRAGSITIFSIMSKDKELKIFDKLSDKSFMFEKGNIRL